MVLYDDGTARAAGWNKYAQCQIPHWRNVTAVSCGFGHSVGLKADGTVLAFGRKDSEGVTHPFDLSGWEDMRFVACDDESVMGMRADGTMLVLDIMGREREQGDWVEFAALTDRTEPPAGEEKDWGVIPWDRICTF